MSTVSRLYVFPAVLAALVASLTSATWAQDTVRPQPPTWTANLDIAAFEKIENARLAAAQKAIDAVTAVKSGRTIDNTLALFDQATNQINSAAYFAITMQAVHPAAAFRDSATAMLAKASSASTALSLDREVYDALVALDTSHADPATQYYVRRQLLEFRLAGVDQDAIRRARLRKLNDKLTDEQSTFARNIADDQKSVRVTDRAELDGLPQDYLDRHKAESGGAIVITTDYPDLFPVLKFAKSDALRRRLFLAALLRGYPKNHEVLKGMMQTRYEIATLLGYASWADYNAADKMIAKGQNIADFIRQVDAAARPAAEREFAWMLAEKRRSDPEAKEIGNYEIAYLTELVRRTKYDFDSQSVRPYFPYARVQQGILDTAAKLFHVSFQQERHAPAWDPSVETWDVLDQNRLIGRFYLDMHPRPGKYSHAEMSALLDGIRGKQLPEAALICNFPAPTVDDPGLMEYGDVVTFFHEFGHLMHHVLGGQQPWAGISGITMEADFGEAPSQMLEEWMRSPQVLASFARHYKTGEAIPGDVVARMNRAEAFGRGSWVTRQNSYTAISYDLFRQKPEDVDLDAVCLGDVQKYSGAVPLAGTHECASFGHLSGMSSGYYTYVWDKVIAEDFFLQFDQKNLLEGPAPMKYRRLVLEPGGSLSANDMVQSFLGRPQNIAAFQRWVGEEFAEEGGKPAK